MQSCKLGFSNMNKNVFKLKETLPHKVQENSGVWILGFLEQIIK